MGYGTVDTSNAADVGLFALPAFFVTFREMLEAAIIISVLLGLLEKMNMQHLKRFVWLGVLAATALCVAAAVIFIIVINVIKDSVAEAGTEILVQGVLSVVAAVLIGVVAVTIGNVMAMHDKWEQRLSEEVGEGAISKREVIFLSFTAVLREGVETIIFFTGIGAAFPPESLPIPAVVGAVVGAIVGVLLYKFGGRLTIQVFFKFTMVLLVFIGAGVFTNGVHELLQYMQTPHEGLFEYVLDIRDCCGLDKSEFWVLMRVLFGYQPHPSGFEILMYVLYHVVTWSFVVIKYQLGIRGGSEGNLLHRLRVCCASYRKRDDAGVGAEKDGSDDVEDDAGDVARESSLRKASLEDDRGSDASEATGSSAGTPAAVGEGQPAAGARELAQV